MAAARPLPIMARYLCGAFGVEYCRPWLVVKAMITCGSCDVVYKAIIQAVWN